MPLLGAFLTAFIFKTFIVVVIILAHSVGADGFGVSQQIGFVDVFGSDARIR